MYVWCGGAGDGDGGGGGGIYISACFGACDSCAVMKVLRYVVILMV
jgi:hypothetical protein